MAILLAAVPALIPAFLGASEAEARPRLVPGPLVGTGIVIGGLSAAGIGLAMMKARAACRADPACRKAPAPVARGGWPAAADPLPAGRP